MATFTNQATLSYNGNIVNSNIVTGNIVEVISVTKTAVDSNYTPGNDITYVLSINNTGTQPLGGITVTDNLGEYTFGGGSVVPLTYVEGSVLYYRNGVLQTAPDVTSTQPLVFANITVPADGNVTLVYDAVANGFAPPAAGGTVTNTVTVSGGGVTTPVSDSETVLVTSAPVLNIIKSLSPDTVSENEELTYTFTIQNTGNIPAAATDNVTVTDVFNPILTDITVTLNGTPLAETSYTYDETTGVFSVSPGIITVPAATYTQSADGSFVVTPGVSVLTVTGTV